MIAFCVFKAFGETLHTQREGTRFDYLKTLLPHSASRCGKRHKSVVLLALSSVFPEDVSVKPASRCEIKESSVSVCTIRSALPKPFLLYRSLTSALISSLSSYISICIV